MNKKLNRIVKIKKINNKQNSRVINYLYKTGVIAGRKIINQKLNVSIIEFKDYTRIWMLENEIEYYTKQIIK
uniref:Cytochrome b6-f complex subunit PetP n=1 Tax=Dicranema revolutum TaxID=239144 RepID=A0A4D6WRL0_9FLOR|nr:cytochrome b6-f complex subunit PetP [Dicranema revolutum]